MAAKVFYYKHAFASGGGNHLSLQDGGTAPTAADTTTIWRAGTRSNSFWCLQWATVDQNTAASPDGWNTTAQPQNAPNSSAGDSWRSENAINGTFAAGNWIFECHGKPTAGGGSGRISIRCWKSANADGTSATEIISAGAGSILTSTASPLNTGVDTAITVTVSAAAITLTNEYLFVQLAWDVVTASGSVNTRWTQRVGPSATVTSPDFTLAGGDITVNVSGPSGAGDVGTVTVAIDVSAILSGLAGTGALGSVIAGTPQLAVPISDIAAGGWTPSTGSALYAMVDETTANDADYIISPNNPTVGQIVEFALTATEMPLTNEGHYVSVRLQANGANLVFTFWLMQGSTTIDTWTESVAVSEGIVTRRHFVPAVAVADIMDHADMRLRIAAA